MKFKLKVLPNWKYGGNISDLTKLDATTKATEARLDGLMELLKEKGGFESDEAFAVLYEYYTEGFVRRPADDFVFPLSEKVANWAREEWRKHRKDKKERGSELTTKTPVLDQGNIGMAEMSDLAIAMLEVVQTPGPELTMLLVELLNVDQHRRSNAEKYPLEFQQAAALRVDNPDITQSEIAIKAGKDKSTISRWMKRADFTSAMKCCKETPPITITTVPKNKKALLRFVE